MTYTRTLLIAWLLATLGFCALAYDMAHAGQVYTEASAGLSWMHQTAPDGTWRQDYFNPTYKGTAFSWQAGLGYAFNDRWSVQTHWMEWGTNRSDTRHVWDSCYNPKTHQRVSSSGDCANVMRLKTADTMRGFDLTASYSFPYGDWIPYVKLGAALMFHRLRADDYTYLQNKQERYGRMPMLEVGAGIRYKLLYAETAFFTALQGQNYHDPVSTQAVITTVGVRVPLF